MSNIHQMLGMNGGSFKRAEQMAYDMIAKGQKDVWLDLALLKHAQGEIKEARQTMDEYGHFYPDCPRLAFGRTWFKLYDGDLEGGLQHIEAGRAVNCLGETNFARFQCPIWDGKVSLNGRAVLLLGEGGIGDQIMGLRAVDWLEGKGARVMVGCAESLMKLFAAQNAFAVVVSEMAHTVQSDFLIPMMSAPRLCNRTWETLYTGQYIKTPESRIWQQIIPSNYPLIDGGQRRSAYNIGLRWRGNPKFEHEQLRAFPSELLFEATKFPCAIRWSLQKDEPQTILPPDVTDLEPLLGDWQQTAAAIAQMDLVVTSCTAIAHLAGAMNKPTWVIVPAMPYWPWARPGEKSQWYPSVRLFRQRCYGVWKEPFEELRKCLGDYLEERAVSG